MSNKNKTLQSIKGKIFKKEKVKETQSTHDRPDYSANRLSTSSGDSANRLSARRGGVEIKGRGADYTIKDGEWKLWVDTLSHEEMTDLKEVFSNFDKCATGEIHPSDLGLCLKYTGENPTEIEIEEMLMLMKTNQRGSIEFPEFATAMAKRRRNSTEIIQKAFEEFDESGDGLISIEEVKTFVSKTLSDENFTQKDFDDLMKDFDIDKDGYLDYGEFMEITQL